MTDSLKNLGDAAEKSGGQFNGFWGKVINIGATAFMYDGFTHLKETMDMKESTSDAFNDFEVVRKALKLLQEQTGISGDKLIGLGGDLSQIRDNSFNFDEQLKKVATTLENAGISTDTFKQALKTAMEESDTSSNTHISNIKEYIGTMGQEFDNARSALERLAEQGTITPSQFSELSTVLQEQEASGATAWKAFEALRTKMEELGIDTGAIVKAFSEDVPEASSATSTAIEKTSDTISEKAKTGFGAVSAAVGTSMEAVQKSTEDAMSAASKSVTDNSEDIATTSKDNWEDSSGYVLDNLKTIKGDTKRIMGKVMTTVQSYWSSVLINTNQIWEAVAKKIEKELGNALTAAERISSEIIGTMNNVIPKVNGSIGNINNALSGIERSFTFTYKYTNPITKRPGTYRSWLSLPSVNTVPYLATGAVIPPRSEFLAVLGDQKNGRNLEAPESLLRQIAREESGGKQGNNIYNISVSASGRNLLDIILEEGELRRNRNGGKNPFKLDE